MWTGPSDGEFLLNEASCCSLALYTPKGRGDGGDAARWSRERCYAIKRGDTSVCTRVAQYISKHLNNLPFTDVLGPDVSLVPMPRSTPRVRGGCWPASCLADAFVLHKLGKEVLPLLERAVPVQNSATAAPGTRPSVRTHFDSLKVVRPLRLPQSITIIDDVIALGATMLGAMSKVSSALPRVSAVGFALFWTLPPMRQGNERLEPSRLVIRLLPNHRTEVVAASSR